jgi:hypothetical protein
LGTDKPDITQDAETRAIKIVAESLKRVTGKINIDVKGNPLLSLVLEGDKVLLDINDASMFGIVDTDSKNLGIFDKLRTTKKVAEILNSNGLTLSILRKGKKAVTLGREATPTVSSLLTGTDDVQIDSIRQVTKLGKDVKKHRRKTAS